MCSLILVTHIIKQCENSFFRYSGEPDPIFFSLKPSRDQDEDNDTPYSPIGSAIFELLSQKLTYIQTDILLLYSKDAKYDCFYYLYV